jgi:uncharacterized SAM-binding protein YcdF (DUF218 family)
MLLIKQPSLITAATVFLRQSVSGGEGTLIKTGKTEAELSKDYLLDIGIPGSSIVVENASKNTIENVLGIKKLICGDARNCLLITSGYHMRRSLAIFAKQKLYPVAYSCDMRGTDMNYGDYFIFKAEALSLWDVFLHETIGFYVYKMMGFL